MRTWASVAGLLSAAALLPVTNASGQEPAADAPVQCGTKPLYGHHLQIQVVGKPIPCERVRAIIRGRCDDGRKWSCFSFRPPDPILVWFLEKERFTYDYSTAIEAVRYPCAEARVTAAAWRASGWEFPTRQQALADDLMRCELLRGKTGKQIVELLGRPGFTERYRGRYHGRHYLSYYIGPERDSYFQIDSESLDIELDRHGIFKSAE